MFSQYFANLFLIAEVWYEVSYADIVLRHRLELPLLWRSRPETGDFPANRGPSEKSGTSEYPPGKSGLQE